MKNNPFMKLYKRLKGDRKGSLAIEIVIGCFIFLIVLSFVFDLMVMSWKFAVVSQTNSYVARTVGLQGGIQSYAPTGFPGGDAYYISISEMQTAIQNNFKRAGISPGEYTVTINGSSLSYGNTTDYRNQINTEIQVKYRWSLISNFIPSLGDRWIKSDRSVLSEFKYRYDTWNGE